MGQREEAGMRGVRVRFVNRVHCGPSGLAPLRVGPEFLRLLGRGPQVYARAPDLGCSSRFVPYIYENVLVSGKWRPHR